MAYVLGGSNGESFGFEKAIANFALMAVHESQGLVNFTNVVRPNQGNTYVIPVFAPLAFQDFDESANSGEGDAIVQNPSLTQASITATPAVLRTQYGKFYGETAAFDLATSLGAQIGEAFGEKVDIRVTAAFASFKATVGNTNYSTSADGFTRPSALGAMELRAVGATGGTATAGFTSTSVLELIRNVKLNWKKAGCSGMPVIVLRQEEQSRLLSELSGGAVNNNISDLGNDILRSGAAQSVLGVQVYFSRFLSTASRAVAGGSAETVAVGAYFGDSALFTVIKQDIEVMTGVIPGGLQYWLTGTGYFGSGIGDPRKGGAVNIEITA